MGVSNTVQQLSVFLENREGRLEEVLDVLAKKGPAQRTCSIKRSWNYSNADRCCSTSCTTCNRFIE